MALLRACFRLTKTAKRKWHILVLILMMLFCLQFFHNVTNLVSNETEATLQLTTAIKVDKFWADESHNDPHFQLNDYVLRMCSKLQFKQTEQKKIQKWKSRMLVIAAKKFLYCPVEKIASTFWRRVIYQLKQPVRRYRHPYEVPINSALSLKRENHTLSHSDWFQFMFVRNPYERVLSAYIDKIFVPNPMFWERFGRPSITMFRENATQKSLKCSHDATFPEFVQFVVWAEAEQKQQDSHFMPASELCLPCEMNYTFVGKIENAGEDFPFVMQHFGLKSSVQSMGENFKNLAANDAIVDSIVSPYLWRSKIQMCMTWDEALMRVWRKLQIRGLIGVSQKYPIAPGRAASVKSTDFVRLAKTARLHSSPEELREQKKVFVKEIYSTVPMSTLQELKQAFHLDFELFGYDQNPDSIFKRNSTHSNAFHYLHFSN